MTWMRLPGETWFAATASFVGMWTAMMIAMMLPSLVPMLWRYRAAVAGSLATTATYLSVIAGAGYFLVWALLGAAIFPIGAVLMALEMQHPALARLTPAATGMAMLVGGGLQFTLWKARHLACCRAGSACCRRLPARVGTAWRYGMSLGIHCVHCCAGLTAVLLISGVMDLRAMAVVTAAITLERLASGGDRMARVIGAAMICAGLFLTIRAVIAGLA
ncbi:hypothetical protein GCM10007863_33150 [Dyella mobilis]|nr:hypothetical protein GCM10007863_33150 [Dyella mobilis]